MDEPDSSSTGRILRSALRARLEGEKSDEASRVVSILEVIHKLKEKIEEKDRIIREKTNQVLQTRDYLNGIFEALGDPVLVIDPEGKVEFANQAAMELLDYSGEQLVGAAASSLWAESDHRAQFEGERLEEQFRLGATQRSDLVLRTRGGKSIPVAWTSSVLQQGGRPSGLVGIARDVRVQRRLEEDKLRTVQALAASVAHEIRNPLGAIQNSVALLQRDLAVSGDDATLLDIVFREADRMSAIISQFLRFAKPSRPTFTRGDLGVLLREVVTLAEQDERAQEGKQLLLHVDASLPELTFDADQTKQVVWNLVSNALDAARERIALRARVVSGGVEVRVADDGGGFAPEILARAAEPFRTTKAQGTGLGLAISKRIVEAHGGTLRLESMAEGGATVSFTLPDVHPEPAD